MGCYSKCCRPACDNGLSDISNGLGCIINGVGKGVCSGLNVLGQMGCALLSPPVCCAPAPRPCCCCQHHHQPRPCAPKCECTCTCRCR